MESSNRVEKTLGFSNIEKILNNKGINRENTYKGINELQRDLKEKDNVKKAFLNIKSPEEAIKIAQNLGYKISEEEIENNEELVEGMLKSVAGGAKVTVRNYSFSSYTLAEGKNSDAETSVTWVAGKEKKP